MEKKPYSIDTINGPVSIIKDKYKGGWKLWTDCGFEFSGQTFKTRKDAIDYIQKYAIK